MQKRVGLGGKCFDLYKFATMLKNSPKIGTGTVTVKNDPRILPFGKFLRKTKINELPQILNILFGNMSFIGPRPLTVQTFALYTIQTKELVMQLKPGLSGIGSIIFRSEEEILNGKEDPIDYYEKFIAPYKGALEEWYFSKTGFSIYFSLMLLTVYVVVFPKNKIVWNLFTDLPVPPKELREKLNYPIKLSK